MSPLEAARRMAVSEPVCIDGNRCHWCGAGNESGWAHTPDCPTRSLPQIVAALEAMAQNVRRGPCTAYGVDGSTCDDCGAFTKPFTMADGSVMPVVPVEQHGKYSACRWKDQAVALDMEREANVALGLVDEVPA